MIDFIANKDVSFDKVERILNASARQRHYTNNGPAKRSLELYLETLLHIDSNKRVLCCSNGTTALHSIMFLLYDKCGADNWVTPAFTFPSCVVGHEFNMDVLDIDPNTYTLPLDEDLLLGYDGVIITNLFGSYVNLSDWTKLCKKTNTALVFDNAASPLSLSGGVNICNFGDYSFGSLHHTKYLGFGEGGFVVCPVEDYDRLNSITNFGFYFGHSGPRKHCRFSSNFKMSDVSAAFIRSHMEKYDIQAHLTNQDLLIDSVSKMSNAQPFNYKPGTVYNTLPVVFNNAVDESYFCNLGIRAHKYYNPLLPQPHSLDLYSKIINFPLYASLSSGQVERIIEAIGGFK